MQANTASLFPVVTAGVSAERFGGSPVFSTTGRNAVPTTGGSGEVSNSVTASLAASWELDLWGAVRRQIEAAGDAAQGERGAARRRAGWSIASSLALDYFALRQADIDIASLKQQQDIDSRILEMTRAAFAQAQASKRHGAPGARTRSKSVIADLQSTEATREQDEHAIAVLIGVPPAAFTLPSVASYAFATPEVPARPAVATCSSGAMTWSARRRTAAAANAQIGVAVAAFFPT